MDRRQRWAAIAIAVGHVLLLAAYTLPDGAVPLRVRYWSQAYARVLFHQDWRLFAPDPPPCGCALSIERRLPGGGIELSDLSDRHHHFVWRRMCANTCRFWEASLRTTTDCPPLLCRSLEAMSGGSPCAHMVLETAWVPVGPTNPQY